MTFKGKEVRVLLVGEAKEAYFELNKLVNEEVSQNITGTFNQTLFNAIKQKLDILKENPQFGVHIPKNKMPREYVMNYDANNIWKVDLPKAWRMIYTIRGSEIEIQAIILDIFDHTDYEKKFGYRKSS